MISSIVISVCLEECLPNPKSRINKNTSDAAACRLLNKEWYVEAE